MHTRFAYKRFLRNAALLLFPLAILAVLGWMYLPNVQGSQDPGVYQRIVTTTREWTGEKGAVFDSEYPPLATILFNAVAANPFGIPFAEAWILTILLAVLVTGLYVLPSKKKGIGWLPYTVPLAILACTLLLSRELVFARFDVFVALSLVLAWNAHDRGRHAHSGFFLLIAASLKLIPFLLLPLFFLTTPRSARKNWIRGVIAGCALAVFLPLLILGPSGFLSNALYCLEYNLMRGFQVESTWSVAQMLPGALQGLRADLQFHHLALHNMDMPMLLSIGAQTLAVAGAVLLAIVGSRTRQPLSLLLPVTMLWILLILPILSPQYFLWFLPLIFVWLTEPSASGKASTRRVVAIFLLATFIGLATRWVYPMHYGQFINEQSLSLILVLNARTLAMLALFLLMVQPMVPAAFRHRLRALLPSLTHRQKHILLIVQLSTASIILFFAGTLLQCFTPLITGEATYRYGDGLEHTTTLPFFVPTEAERLDVRYSIALPSPHPAVFRIKPDDCIETMEINGKPVDAARIAFCDYGAGKPVDIGDYLRPGRNDIHVVLKDTGGIGGLAMSVSVRDPLTLFLGLTTLASLVWIFTIVLRLFPRRRPLSLALPLLVVAAAVLRWWYVVATPFNTRGHDTDAHIDYIEYVLQYFRIPLAVDGWEYHQPPLYYFLTAIFAVVGEWIGRSWTTILGLLQYVSVLFSILTFASALWIGMMLFPRPAYRSRLTLYGALLAVFPALVFLASAISNDPLYQCLAFAVVATLLHWWLKGSWRSWYATAALIALAMLTKVSASAFVPLVFFCLLIRRRLPWRKKLLHGGLALIIITIVAGWLPVMRLLEPNPNRTLTLGNEGMSSQLVVPNVPSSFIIFNPVQILKIPYNNPWIDESRRQYFWEYFFRSAFFGEYSFPDFLQPVAKSILFFGLLSLPLLALGFLWTLLKRTYALLPLWLLTLMVLASSVSYRFRFPYGPNQDFRFVAVLLIPLAYYAVCAPLLLKKWKRIGDAILWGLVLSCGTFLLLLPFGS